MTLANRMSTDMRKVIDKICDILYPRDPNVPDPTPLWAKLLVLGMLGSLLAIGIAANWRW